MRAPSGSWQTRWKSSKGMWLRADEYIDVDDDRLIIALTFGGRAGHTGLEIENSVVHVFR